MVKVLVGSKASRGSFSGFVAEFEGGEISSYEADGTVYTLYKCTAYDQEAYRVHTQKETDPKEPVYELHPDSGTRGGYDASPYTREQIAEYYPLFLKDMIAFSGLFEVRPMDRTTTS